MTWNSEGLTQSDFMRLDECIVVSPEDIISGSANKRDCHRFEKETPKGRLHRAFSVFLFDSNDRLLLQQRASVKVSVLDSEHSDGPIRVEPCTGHLPFCLDQHLLLASASRAVS